MCRVSDKVPSSKEVFEHVAVVMYRSGTAGTLNDAVFLVELELLRTVVLVRSSTNSHRVGAFFCSSSIKLQSSNESAASKETLEHVERLRCFLAGLFIVV